MSYIAFNDCNNMCVLPQSKYKEASKKDMQSGSFTTLRETRDTAHSKEINKLVSGVQLPHIYFRTHTRNLQHFCCCFLHLAPNFHVSFYRKITKQSLRRRRASQCTTK